MLTFIKTTAIIALMGLNLLACFAMVTGTIAPVMALVVCLVGLGLVAAFIYLEESES